jgi:multidrug resistance efflux pump
MIVVLLNVYLVTLFILVKTKIVRFNLFWKISPVLVLLLLLVGLFIPMGWGAPQGSALIVRNSVEIVPNVSGQVIDVPVVANVPLKANDVLFRIDPTPFDYKVKQLKAELAAAQQKVGQLNASLDAATANVKALDAQLAFSKQRLEDYRKLASTDATTKFRVEDEQKQAETLAAQLDAAKAQEIDGVNTDVARLTAALGNAQWELEQTTVRAPADGYVTNLALRKGARVTNLPLAPVMAFIDTSETIIGVEIAQIDARYVRAGQNVEITFKFAPGQVYTGKVTAVLQAIATGQMQTSGLAATPKQIQAAPFVARVALDDTEFARRLPAGSTGEAAIFTDRVRASHVIRRVLLRQVAITNYINPF